MGKNHNCHCHKKCKRDAFVGTWINEHPDVDPIVYGSMQVLKDGTITAGDTASIGELNGFGGNWFGLPYFGKWKKTCKKKYEANTITFFTDKVDGTVLYKARLDYELIVSCDGKSYTGTLKGSFFAPDDKKMDTPLFSGSQTVNGTKIF